MKRILLFVMLSILVGNMAYAQLTPEERQKKRQIRYALKNRIISPLDVPAENYFKYGLTEELKKTLHAVGRPSGAYLHAELEGHKCDVYSVYVSNGKIVSGDYNNTIKIWDLQSGKLLKTLTGHKYLVHSVCVSDGKIVSSSDDDTIKIWDLQSGKLLKTLTGHKNNVYSVCVSDGKIVSGSYDNTIKIWDLRSGRPLKTLTGHKGTVYSVCASDGKIVSGSYDNTIKIWDLQSGKLLKTLTGHKNTVNSVYVSEGKIVSGSDDNTVKIWDLQSGRPLKTLTGHKYDVNSVFVSDGQIVSGSDDNTIKIWDLQSGKLLKTLTGHKDDVNSVFVSDGQIVSGSDDNSIRIIEVLPSDSRKENFRKKAEEYFSNTIFQGESYEQAKRLPLHILNISANSFAKRHIEHQLEKYQLRLRNSFKNGVIGERYVPYTTTSYTSHDYDYVTIDGNLHNIGRSKTHSSSSGGYKEDVYGYKAIYEVKNFSDQYYIVDLKSDWTGSYSSYIEKGYAWSDSRSGSYSDLKTKSSALSYDKSFVLAPGEKFKYQFEVGEKEPADLLTVPARVVVIKKDYYNGLLKAMDDKNRDTKVIDTYLKSDLVSKWHPTLIRRKKQIIKEREDRFSEENIAAVTVRLEYDKEDYDKDFNDNQVTIVISSKKPLEVKYETPFAQGTASVAKKAHRGSDGYEYRKMHRVGGIAQKDLCAKATYVWPAQGLRQ